MAKRMLIDAAHPEETRVVVLNGSRLEEFDFETSTKKQIKGNIYLAKVTRVEPSLQAAFVEYGGNRHGFLAFNEIHPDYYRIPVADRQAALEAERVAEQAANAREEFEREHGGGGPPPAADYDTRAEEIEPLAEDFATDPGEDFATGHPDDLRMAHAAPAETLRATEAEAEAEASSDDADFEDADDFPASPLDDPWRATLAPESPQEQGEEVAGDASDHEEDESPLHETAAAALAELVPDAPGAEEHADSIETVGGDEMEETARPRARPFRHYKIQEVIKRRQIMLVQVTKEERGNKGAALTTYLSLAGRYCVLMPNTPRGGGVSRKITNSSDRRRLKDLMSDLDVPEGMGVIVRTAGSERSKAEIKRDFEYLLRLWDEIRDLTLKSTAPALIYEEGNLIKRAIRDLYARDIDEVVVDGEEGYRTAKSFMKMLMPSHAKRVKLFHDPGVALFHRHQVEQQIDAIHSPVVQLRSGGYIVMNPTEALVAIDVNSGRSTKERNIEETALKTNTEAADEIARQLRLRDLAGLVVIDFIDMEEYRNRAAVERRLKDAMRYDRARIQLGRISPFGLLELSRQRLRPSLVEASTQPCPYCNGTGHIRSIESAALHVLRAIEEEGMRRRSGEIAVQVPTKVALYILNQKRAALQQMEGRFGMSVTIGSDDTLVPPAYRLDRLRALTPAEIAALPSFTAPPPEPEEDEDIAAEEEETTAEAAPIEPGPFPIPETPVEAEAGAEDGGRGRRHRHQRRGRGEDKRRDARPPQAARAEEGHEDEVEAEAEAPPPPRPHEPAERHAGESQAEAERRRRRRGRRGGRRRRRDGQPPPADLPQGAEEYAAAEPFVTAEGAELPEADTIELVPPEPDHDEAAHEVEEAFAAPPAPPESGLGTASVPVSDGAAAPEPAPQHNQYNVPPAQEVTGPVAKPRRGWWRR